MMGPEYSAVYTVPLCSVFSGEFTAVEQGVYISGTQFIWTKGYRD